MKTFKYPFGKCQMSGSTNFSGSAESVWYPNIQPHIFLSPIYSKRDDFLVYFLFSPNSLTLLNIYFIIKICYPPNCYNKGRKSIKYFRLILFSCLIWYHNLSWNIFFYLSQVLPPIVNAKIAFWTWSLFSAWSYTTTDWSPSITSSITSTPQSANAWHCP